MNKFCVNMQLKMDKNSLFGLFSLQNSLQLPSQSCQFFGFEGAARRFEHMDGFFDGPGVNNRSL